jgi:UDP-N-acetylmuramoyl-L-alanyl-D-glutamate--2,6-diaminopimelate ligase
MPGLKHAVINGDDLWGKKLVASITTQLITYGIHESAKVRAIEVKSDRSGSRFDLKTNGHQLPLSFPLLGRHNVYNALAATSAALSLGIEPQVIVSALSKAKPARGRLEEVPCGEPYRVFIDYAHTEDALRNALLAVREGCGGRIIVVFGCGGNRDKSKRIPMGRVASRLADLPIITSDNPRRENPLDIIKEISKGCDEEGKNCQAIQNRREAIAAALAEAGEGDIVLVAGKGHERTQEFDSTVVPFNDRDVIMELAGRV